MFLKCMMIIKSLLLLLLLLFLFFAYRLCWEKFGWGSQKVDELIVPVLKEYAKHEVRGSSTLSLHHLLSRSLCVSHMFMQAVLSSIT